MKKIVNVRKFIVSNTILLILLLVLGASIINVTYSYNDTKYKTLYITQGDTLWKIAESEQRNNPYYKNQDIRNIIYDIKHTNKLEKSNLEIGQEIKIPIK